MHDHRGFVLEAGRLDFVRRFAVPVLNKCDLLLHVFGSGPVAQDDFEPRHDFAIDGDPFMANFLTKFPECIKIPRSPSAVDPPVACREWPTNDGLTFAVVCSMLRVHSRHYVASSLACQLFGNKTATAVVLPSIPLASGAKGCGFDPRRAYGSASEK
jgi:hypothetical protein